MLICGEPPSGQALLLPEIIRQGWRKPRNVEGARSLFMQKRLEVFFLLSPHLTLIHKIYFPAGPERSGACVAGLGQRGDHLATGMRADAWLPVATCAERARGGPSPRPAPALGPSGAQASVPSNCLSPSARPASPGGHLLPRDRPPPPRSSPLRLGLFSALQVSRPLHVCLFSFMTSKWGSG